MTGRSRDIGLTARGWYGARLACLAASAALFALAVIVIGALTPGYDQWSDAVSELASPGEPRALAARAAFAAYGLLVVAGAGALRQYAGHLGTPLVLCVTLYGAACVVAGVAPKDLPGAVHTTVSQVHVTAAIVAGALAVGAMALVSARGPTRFTWGTPVYGVSERLLLGLFWISALAIRALRPRQPGAAAG
jgi:hypothetical protein